MSLIIADGFDHYDSLDELAMMWSGGYPNNVEVPSTALMLGPTYSRFAGGNGLRMYCINNQNAAFVQNFTNRGTLYFGISIKIVLNNVQFGVGIDGGAGPQPLLAFYDGESTQMTFGLNGSNQVIINATSPSAISSQPISVGEWHRLEFKVVFNTAGTVECRLDGVSIVTWSGNTAGSSLNPYANSMYFGPDMPNTGSSMDIWVDDVLLYDDQGAAPNSFLGDTRCSTLLPTGNGTQNDYAISGSTPAATAWQSTDDNPPDLDVTTLTNSTVGNIQRFTYPATSSTNIFALVVLLLSRKDDAGVRSLRAACKSGSTLADNGADFVQLSTYAYYEGAFAVDPNTSAQWTASGVNAAEFGAKTTA